jgi:hypothetical protein
MAKHRLSFLPGDKCLHFARGRCLYEERLNPGYHAGWRCRIIRRLEDEYDHFLRQMESFQMDEEEAFGIWDKRLTRLLESDALCADFAANGERELPGCSHVHGDVCMLALPACGGTCRLFRPRPSGQDDPESPEGPEPPDGPGTTPGPEREA